MRYKYNAHWYITEIPNEVRVTQGVDENGKTFPERMQYSAIIQREYVYYNQNNERIRRLVWGGKSGISFPLIKSSADCT